MSHVHRIGQAEFHPCHPFLNSKQNHSTCDLMAIAQKQNDKMLTGNPFRCVRLRFSHMQKCVVCCDRWNTGWVDCVRMAPGPSNLWRCAPQAQTSLLVPQCASPGLGEMPLDCFVQERKHQTMKQA